MPARRKNPFFSSQIDGRIPYLIKTTVFLLSPTAEQDPKLVALYQNLNFISHRDPLTDRWLFNLGPQEFANNQIPQSDYTSSVRYVFNSEKFKSEDITYKPNDTSKLSLPIEKIILALNKIKADTTLQLETLLSTSDMSEFKTDPYGVLDESFMQFLYALQEGDARYRNDLNKQRSEKDLLSRIKTIYKGITNKIYRNTLAELKKSELLSLDKGEMAARRTSQIYKADQILKQWFSQRLPTDEELRTVASQFPDLQIPPSRHEYLFRMLAGYSVPVIPRDYNGNLIPPKAQSKTYAGKNRDSYQQVIPGKTYVPKTLFDYYSDMKVEKPYEEWLKKNWIPLIKKWDFKPQFTKVGGGDILEIYEGKGELDQGSIAPFDEGSLVKITPLQAFLDINEVIERQCADLTARAWYATLDVVKNEIRKEPTERCFRFDDFLYALELYNEAKDGGFEGDFEDFDKNRLDSRFSEALTPTGDYTYDLERVPDIAPPTEIVERKRFDQDPFLTYKVEQIRSIQKIIKERISYAIEFYNVLLRLQKYAQYKWDAEANDCLEEARVIGDKMGRYFRSKIKYFEQLKDYATYRIDLKSVSKAYLTILDLLSRAKSAEGLPEMAAERILKPLRQELLRLDKVVEEMRRMPERMKLSEFLEKIPKPMQDFILDIPSPEIEEVDPTLLSIGVGDFFGAYIDGKPMGVRIVEILDDAEGGNTYYGVALQEHYTQGTSDNYRLTTEIDYITRNDFIEKLDVHRVLGYPKQIPPHQKADPTVLYPPSSRYKQNPYRSLDFMLVYSSILCSLLNVLYARIWCSSKFALISDALSGESFNRDIELQGHLARIVGTSSSSTDIGFNDAIYYWFSLGQKTVAKRFEGKVFAFKKTPEAERQLPLDYFTKQKIFRNPTAVINAQFQEWVQKFPSLNIESLQTYLFGYTYFSSSQVNGSIFANQPLDKIKKADIEYMQEIPYVTWSNQISNTQFPKVKDKKMPYIPYLARVLWRPQVRGTEVVPISAGAYQVTLPSTYLAGTPILRKITPFGAYSRPLTQDQYAQVMREGTPEAKAMASRQLTESDYYYALPIFYVPIMIYGEIVQKYNKNPSDSLVLSDSSSPLSRKKGIAKNRRSFDKNCIFPIAFVVQDVLTKWLVKNIKDIELKLTK